MAITASPLLEMNVHVWHKWLDMDTCKCRLLVIPKDTHALKITRKPHRTPKRY